MKKMDIGVIIRDCKSEVAGATLVEPKGHIIASDVVEAMAALRAIKFRCNLGYYQIILEGNALKIM
jgi:hypothetical protein